jgi:exodeoxyribonuclease VII large subunit
MPDKGSSQWDFGDLFGGGAKAKPKAKALEAQGPEPPSPRPAPRTLSVTELTLGIKRQLEGGFGAVRVAGEISNYRLQSSGHAYFVLKDANAQLSCVLFRGQGGAGRSSLRDGAQVTLGGDVTVYEPRGQYQLRVDWVEVQGVGALQAAFERLKAKLAAEGLFDPARKRPIPALPKQVGLVTSPTGAAIRDVLHVVGRRYAGLEFILAPARVQGAGAAEEIAAALGLLNQWSAEQGEGNGLDAILVTRGGGSLEDLWAFNEEPVARAIAASAVPVISAVGHEIDFSIADFVADLRAATPSAAAEILTAGYVASREFVAASALRLGQLARRRLEALRDDVERLEDRLGRVHPRRRLETWTQRVDDLSAAMQRAVRQRLRLARSAQVGVAQRLSAQRPSAVLSRRRRELESLVRRLPAAAAAGIRERRSKLEPLSASLRLLSPLSVLERGYSLTTDAATGRVLRNGCDLKSGQRLRTRFAQGEAESLVVPATLPRP